MSTLRRTVMPCSIVPATDSNGTRTFLQRWEHHFEALVRYASTTGHAGPPVDFVSADDIRLGKWVATQRSMRREGRLSRERVARLDASPGWVWHVNRLWEDHYAALVRFAGETGHACPPLSYETADGHRFGAWVIKQRNRYRAGRSPSGKAERFAALPGWVWLFDNPAGYDAAWEDAFCELQQFADAHGHTQPPFKDCSGRIRLGVRAHKQRRLYRDGRLTAERAQRLERLPEWVWVGHRGHHPQGSPAAVSSSALTGAQCSSPRR